MHVNLDADDIKLIKAAIRYQQEYSGVFKKRYDEILAKLDSPSIQSLGGLATKGISTEAKTLAARANGAKGGRPRKVK